MALQLEPQGLLFAEIKFLNPMISRKPKLQRQRKIFKQEVKNFPRANQMNINVATWGRLLKRSSPGIQQQNRNNNQPLSPPGIQPIQLVFDSTPEDKAETPGEIPTTQGTGLGGQRPLSMPVGGVAVLPPDVPPPPPPTQQAPPPTAKKRVPSTPPPPPPRLDQEVRHFLFRSFLEFIFFKDLQSVHNHFIFKIFYFHCIFFSFYIHNKYLSNS